VLARNIETLALPGATLRRSTVASVVAADADQPVDLVLADPPYDVDAAEIDSVLATLTAHGWAGPGTVAAVERAAAGARLTWPAGWLAWPHRIYGDTRLELAELSGAKS
jgi:16S rRNA G966 N2-methylase RsmD